MSAAGRTNKRADRHINIGRSSLAAVEAMAIVYERCHFSQHPQLLLILINFLHQPRHFLRGLVT